MAFPTTPILDTGVRANENPAVGWVDGPDGLVYGTIEIFSNTIHSPAGDAWSYWNAADTGADCECYATVTTKPSNGQLLELFVRMTPIGASVDGYYVEVAPAAGTDVISLWRMDNGVGTTQLGAAFNQEVSNGDGLGISAIGSSISAYYRSGAGSWTLLGSRTDATYSAGGKVGVYFSDTSVAITDFGGGTVANANTRLLAATGVGR